MRDTTMVILALALCGTCFCEAETVCDFERGLDGWRQTADVRLTLVEGRTPNTKAMRVDFVSDADNWSPAEKPITTVPAGAEALTLWIRSDATRPVTAEVYLRLKAGGQYRAIVLATRHWRQVTIPFAVMREWGAKSELNPSTISGLFLRPFGVKQTLLLDDIAFVKLPATPAKPGDVSFTIDAGKSLGKLPRFWAGFNPVDWGGLTWGDPAFFRDDIRGSGIRDLGITHVRVWGFFSDGNAPWHRNKPPFVAVYRGQADGKPVYDFGQIDILMDYVVKEMKLTPMVCLGFMPDALAQPGAKNIGYGAGKRGPPRDWKIWDALVRDTVRHLIRRYGRDEVRRWQFEVWNEPDLWHIFWVRKDGAATYNDADVEAYNELYDHTAEAVKSVDAELAVGGPATAGYHDFLTLWVKHCTGGTNAVTGRQGSPVDFLTLHSYGPTTSFYHKVRMMNALRRRYPALAKVPLVASEYGPGDQGGDLYRSYAAAEFLRTVHLVQGMSKPVMMYYHGVTVGGFAVGPTGWSFGMYLRQGTQLYPTAMNTVYRLMQQWGDERLAVEGSRLGDRVAAIASKGMDGVAVAVYHVDTMRKADGEHPTNVTLTLSNLGDFSKVTLYRVDHAHHDLYSYWADVLKRPEADKPNWRPFSAELETKLIAREALTPSPLGADATVRDGTLRCTLDVPTNGVAFVFVERP